MQLIVTASTKDDILTALPFIEDEIEHGYTSGGTLGASWEIKEEP